MKKSSEEFSIKDFLSIFVPKIWIILLISVVVAVLFGGNSAFLKKDTYTSDASLIMSKQNYAGSGDIDLVYNLIDMCIEVMYKDSFLTDVSNAIKTKYADFALEGGWNLSPSYIASVTKVNKLGSNQVFDVVVTTGDPMLSYAITDCFASTIDEKLPELLPYSEGLIDFNIVEQATVATKPNSRKVLSNSLIGFAIGLVVALVGVFVFSVLDVVIRDKKKLEDNFDLPVLGVIPDFEISADN